MKFIAITLILSAAYFASAAEYPTALEISMEFKSANDHYVLEATKFAESLAAMLDGRLATYIANHQKLVTHFASVRLVPGAILDANSEKIMAKLTARIQELTLLYPKVLDRNIFSTATKKHIDMLKSGYLAKAEDLIKELGDYVTQNPKVGKCWAENREEILDVVETAVGAAKQAGFTAINNADTTLTTNENLIDGLINADKNFIELCKASGPTQSSSCISSFLTIADVTFPATSSIWEMTTNNTVSLNLKVAESTVQTATQVATSRIDQIVFRIENCVNQILTESKA